MPSFNNREDHFRRNLSTHGLLIVLCALLIVWLMPRKAAPHFEVIEGKPWHGEVVLSEFEFQVMKSDEAIAREKAEKVRKEFIPTFNRNDSVREIIEKTLFDSIDARHSVYANAAKNHFRMLLEEIYQHGVVDQHIYERIQADYAKDSIRIVKGTKGEVKPLSDVFSEQEAYNYIRYMDEEYSHLAEGLAIPSLIPSLEYNDSISRHDQQEIEEKVAVSDRTIQQGDKIIGKGERVDEQTARALNQLYEKRNENRTRNNDSLTNIVGHFIYVLLLLALFTTYLILYRRKYFNKVRHTLMLYSLITLFPLLTSLLINYMALSVYILPYAMVPIFVSIFMDTRTAFVAHITMVMIGATTVFFQEEFFILQMVAGMTAIYALRDMSKRSDLFKAAVVVTLCTAIMAYALSLIRYESFIPANRFTYVHLIISGILLLLVYPLMFVVEKAFGFTSNVTLFELSDTNKDLLRRLSEVAPGTFQHSITVGNLAAEIARKIGADSLLVRTGALYHDIGKMVNPVFFTENQAGVNPHDKLTEKESASIIISHVTEGLRLAEEKGLPDVIKNFITTHHGAGMVKYFYVKYKNAHPKEEVDEETFSYPGPNPFTREQAILMMADTVEAASRSLNEYTDESLSGLINRLIDTQVNAGYFTDCPITFLDINIAKKVLLENLKSIYHTRIKYPELRQDTRTDSRKGKRGKLKGSNKKDKS